MSDLGSNTSRTCTRCGSIFTLKQCGSCRSSSNAAWAADNPEKIKALRAKASKKWYEANRERAIDASKKKYASNPKSAKEAASVSAQRNRSSINKSAAYRRATLSDGYVAVTLGLPMSLCSSGLIEVKRSQLEMKRLNKTLIDVVNDKLKGESK